MTDDELAKLSDEEIMNMVSAPPPAAPEAAQNADEGAGQNQEEQEQGVADAEQDEDPDSAPGSADPAPEAASVLDDPDDGDEPAADATGDADKAGGKDPAADPAPAAGQPGDKGDKKAKPDAQAPQKDQGKPEDVKTQEAAPVDYKAAYERIMAPFKAAGKMVKITSPDDVIQLMQKGAHYTQKMQALSPHLKLVRMLENNGLLDEGKLSFLIDVNRKDPAAIQKLVRDSGVDPQEIDTSVEPDYKPGNHKVSDQEMEFQTTLDEVASSDAGRDFVIEINKAWDKPSKEILGKDPSILRILAGQKASGIYDKITAEVERRRILGYLGNEPFLAAYDKVGKEMQANGALTPKAATTATDATNPAQAAQGGNPASERRVVETRPAQQRTTVSNNDKARAASSTRAAPSTTKPARNFNPLALSDEDFEKNADLAGRL